MIRGLKEIAASLAWVWRLEMSENFGEVDEGTHLLIVLFWRFGMKT